MRIKLDPLNNLYEVVEPFSELGEFYLTDKVVEALKSEGKLESLEDMQFLFLLDSRCWEISAKESPVGTGIASVVFSIQGNLYQQDAKIICDIK